MFPADRCFALSAADAAETRSAILGVPLPPPEPPRGAGAPAPRPPAGDVACSCYQKVKGRDCSQMFRMRAVADCQRGYGGNCGMLVACIEGEPSAMPSCAVGWELGPPGNCYRSCRAAGCPAGNRCTDAHGPSLCMPEDEFSAPPPAPAPPPSSGGREGEPCNGNSDCAADGFCYMQACAKKNGPGEACGADYMCRAGLSCCNLWEKTGTGQCQATCAPAPAAPSP